MIQKMFYIIPLLSTIIVFSNCSFKNQGGAIPVFMDEFTSTTPERRFQLDKVMMGQVLEFQEAYTCNNDSLIYTSTTIVKVENEIITIYSPCLQETFSKNDLIKISPIKELDLKYLPREIYKPFPKSSKNYGYWECISCKYRNALGSIERGI